MPQRFTHSVERQIQVLLGKFRLTKTEKRLFEEKVRHAGMNLSDCLRMVALKAAEEKP